MSQPLENTNTFVTEDPANGQLVEDQVTLLEVFLERSTSNQKEIYRTTGRMLKEDEVAQDYYVSLS